MSRFLDALRQLDQTPAPTERPAEKTVPRLAESVREKVLPKKAAVIAPQPRSEAIPVVMKAPRVAVESEANDLTAASARVESLIRPKRDALSAFDHLAAAIQEVQEPAFIRPAVSPEAVVFSPISLGTSVTNPMSPVLPAGLFTPPAPTPAQEPTPKLVVERRPATRFETELFAELRDTQRSAPYRALSDTIRRDCEGKERPIAAIFSVEASAEVGHIAVRLAALSAERHEKPTVLLDLNAETRHISHAFGCERRPGLMEFLSRRLAIESLVLPTALDTLRIIPFGIIPLDPAANASDRLLELLEHCRKEYAHVMIDADTITSSLALTVGRASDAAYLAVRLGETPSRIAAEQAERFRRGGGKLSGCIVLNETA